MSSHHLGKSSLAFCFQKCVQLPHDVHGNTGSGFYSGVPIKTFFPGEAHDTPAASAFNLKRVTGKRVAGRRRLDACRLLPRLNVESLLVGEAPLLLGAVKNHLIAFYCLILTLYQLLSDRKTKVCSLVSIRMF